jgi:hypothetical protein
MKPNGPFGYVRLKVVCRIWQIRQPKTGLSRAGRTAETGQVKKRRRTGACRYLQKFSSFHFMILSF